MINSDFIKEPFSKYQEEYSSGEIKNAKYDGFSERLNIAIDQTDLGFPPLGNGRAAALAQLTGASKMTTGDWLNKDAPPKTTTLRTLSTFLVNHLDNFSKPGDLEVWLKYANTSDESSKSKLSNIELSETFVQLNHVIKTGNFQTKFDELTESQCDSLYDEVIHFVGAEPANERSNFINSQTFIAVVSVALHMITKKKTI